MRKVREQAMKRISKKHSDRRKGDDSKTLEKKMSEIRAFYEGDIIQMDRVQKDYKDTGKVPKWYNWDMVMVIPNPDYDTACNNEDPEMLEDVKEATHRYNRCFKRIYRENQIEMKKERELEKEIVRQIIIDNLTDEDQRVRNTGGGRFKLSEERKAVDSKSSNFFDGGRYEGDENMEYIPNEAGAAQVKEVSVNNTDDEDLDKFIDTRVYLSDLKTMMLNALIYRMNKVLGFETLLLMSRSGKEMYLLIKASNGDLKKHAQDQQYQLSLNVGYTDLDTQPPFSIGKFLALTHRTL